jgi:uncharacterized protein
VSLYPFSLLGRFFVVHGETGSFFEVDQPVFEKVQQDECPDELTAVLPEQPDLEWIRKQLEQRPRQLSALCLNVTHTCNMACKYCFAQQGNYGGQQAVMDFAVAKDAVDLLMESPSSWADIDFFGGEPLIAWDTVKQTLAYATERAVSKNKKIRFSLTTNGLLLTPNKLDVLDHYNVNLTLSLDGPRVVHDKFRVDRAKNGTFDKVMEAFKEVERRRQGKNYYVRGTFTHDTLNFSESVAFLVDQGFKTISMEPVTGEGLPWSIKWTDLPIIEQEYEKLANFYLMRAKEGNDKRFYFYHFELNPMNPPSVLRRFTGCGAGVEYLAVNPKGDIFPCHQFDNVLPYKMGNVGQAMVKPHPDFVKAHALNKKHCQECWARALCGGGCHADSFFTTGNIWGQNQLSCEIVRMRLRYALAVNAVLQDFS